MDRIVAKAFEEVRLVERIYWEQEIEVDKPAPIKEEKWNLFKSLNLGKQSSIDQFRKEEEISNKTITQSITINNGSQ